MRSAQLYGGSSAKITPEQNSNDTTIRLKINVTEHYVLIKHLLDLLAQLHVCLASTSVNNIILAHAGGSADRYLGERDKVDYLWLWLREFASPTIQPDEPLLLFMSFWQRPELEVQNYWNISL